MKSNEHAVMTSVEYVSMILGVSMASMQDFLSILLMAVSVLVGILNMILLLKKVFIDGKIDDKEQEEINKAIEDIMKITGKEENKEDGKEDGNR